ncbi:hypothetical protein BDN72DRAFT_90817 [Pluteus cervinus]|uniref:Uncharacterized protein n=1 Tax=Pluteus cervinus TaxID=181527 RepID=A0ACD3APC9_9AGAR|nr:hypothetical protein BDN72DRAFT_90817 [Pluteus cervinus]
MASSSLAPHTTPQALSYADRAKKAQNIKSSNSLQPPRAVHTPLPPNASPTTSRSIKSSPAISKSSSMSSTAADTSTVVLTTSPFQPGPSSSPVSERQVNGSSSASTEPDAIISTAINSQQPPSKASTANFWNLRREKQAAQSPQPSSTQSSSSSPHSVSPNPQSQRSKDSSTLQPSSASYNDSDALEPDPFVVRPPPRPPRVYPAPTVPPLLHDPEAWPAVGQAPSASQLTPPPPAAVAVETYDQDSTETGTGAGLSKQSEKSKWVSLPVQADEAASDKGHRHNPRRGFQNTQVHPSRNNSQAQTRTPSGRTSSTHSVSQSRVNSRTNSAHSSPHLSRSRRLPSDDPTNPLNGGTSSRSSGRNSPRPHPFTHRGPTLSVDPNLAPPIATPMPMYGPPTATTINGTTYFPQPSPIHLPLTVPQDPLQYPHSASGHSPL